MRIASRLAALLLACVTCAMPARAHERGRPVPVGARQTVGPYDVSLWASTDVGTGSVYVVIHPRDGVPFVAPSSVHLALRPRTGADSATTYRLYAKPVSHGARFSTAVWLDHADAYDVQVTLDGTAGRAVLQSSFDVGSAGEFGLPAMLVYAAPFVLVAGLWVRGRAVKRVPQARVAMTSPTL